MQALQVLVVILCRLVHTKPPCPMLVSPNTSPFTPQPLIGSAIQPHAGRLQFLEQVYLCKTSDDA